MLAGYELPKNMLAGLPQVRADLHREGLLFPTSLVHHQVGDLAELMPEEVGVPA